MRLDRVSLAATVVATILPTQALGADLDGAQMGLPWALPFAGMLLSIALFPLVAPHFWEHHQGKIAFVWAALVLASLVFSAGAPSTSHALMHTLLLEYVLFILLLVALFTVAGGIVVRGNFHGSPAVNALLLAVGTLLASVIGTTGASMVMIRPVLRANDDRRSNVHVFVFFILSCLDHRRVSYASRRSASVPRLLKGSRFLLDDHSFVA